MDLIFGAGRLDRSVADAEELLVAYGQDIGTRYLDHISCTPPDRLVPEDLAVTILINSRVGSTAFVAVQDHGSELNLATLPDKPLQDTTPSERQQLAELIEDVARWPGFAASVASKVLHKKRPALIPIIDNQAIFGAYMNPLWPDSPSLADSVYAASRVREALDWIAFDIARPENRDTWTALAASEPTRTLIDLFDMVWWIYFRTVEPVRVAPSIATASLGPGVPSAPPRDEAPAVLVSDLVEFVDDDDGYLTWVRDHPSGFVVNTRRDADRRLPEAPSSKLRVRQRDAVSWRGLDEGLRQGLRGRPSRSRRVGAQQPRRGPCGLLALRALIGRPCSTL